MAAIKPSVRRDSKQLRAMSPRAESYIRVKSPHLRQDDDPRGVAAPSTLPPAPFEHETAVRELEWWLDAHMALVSRLAWLEQQLQAGEEGEAHLETMLRLTAGAEAVRDALYELYCDAADARLGPAVGPGAALGEHVRGIYAWCGRVVTLLAAIASGLRAASGPDWAAARAAFRKASAVYPTPSAEVRVAVAELSINTASPVEPLRHLPRNVDMLFSAIDDLQTTMAKRFG
jgi:hypothetical protein